MTDLLLTTRQAAERLGLPRRTFDRYARLGKFRNLRAAQPVGHRKWIAEAVDQFGAGESLIKLVRRTA